MNKHHQFEFLTNRALHLVFLFFSILFVGSLVRAYTHTENLQPLAEQKIVWLGTAALITLTLGRCKSVFRQPRIRWIRNPTPSPQPKTRTTQLFILGLLISLIFSFLPILNTKTDITFFRTDIVRFLGYHYFTRDCLLRYGELPLRTPWGNGGFPMAGHPEFVWPNPCFVITLICGETLGLKIWWLLLAAIHGIGMFLVGLSVLEVHAISATAASIALTYSLWLSRTLTDGNYYSVPYAFTPLLMYLLFRMRWSRGAFYAFAGIICSLSFDCYYYSLALATFLCLFALVSSVRVQNATIEIDSSYARSLLRAAMLILCLGMIKYVPVTDFMTQPGMTLRLFVEPEEAMVGGKPTYDPHFIKGYHPTTIMRQFIDNHRSLYVGLPLLVCALIGMYVQRRKSIRWLWLFWFCALLSMAHNSPIDLFRILWKYGYAFKAMRHPDTYFDYFLLLIVIAGFAFTIDRLVRNNRIFIYIALAIIPTAILPIACLHQKILIDFAEHSSAVEQHLERYSLLPNGFYQIEYLGTHRCREYPVIKKHIGVVDWYSSLVMPTSVQARYFLSNDSFIENAAYRGEAYLLNSDSAITDIDITPNKIIIRGHTAQPDVLVINQNFHKFWRSAEGVLQNRDNLLSIGIDKPGTFQITCTYVDSAFKIGLFFTLLTICWICIRESRKSKEQRS